MKHTLASASGIQRTVVGKDSFMLKIRLRRFGRARIDVAIYLNEKLQVLADNTSTEGSFDLCSSTHLILAIRPRRYYV